MSAKLSSYCALRRKQLGLSQTDIANKLGYTVQAISRFENGLSSMSISSLPALANALQISLDDLLGENENPTAFKGNAEFNPDAFGHNLAYFRLQKGLTQAKLASILDSSSRNIASYEKGASLPSLDFLITYIDYFKIKPSSLFGEKQGADPIKAKHKWPLSRLFLIIPLVLVVTTGSATGIYFSLKNKNGNSGETATTSSENASNFFIFKRRWLFIEIFF
jgi:transcriptional regulator with XRE-family HTH domain